MTQIVQDVFLNFLAFIIGVFMYKKLNTFFKLQLLQLLIALLLYGSSRIFTAYQLTIGFQIDELNNAPVYNIYILLELIILLLASISYFRSYKAKVYHMVGFTFFISIYLFQLYQDGIWSFINYGALISGILLVIIYLFVLYNSLVSSQGDINWPISIMSLGLIVYFGCTIPYLGLFHYLNHNYSFEFNYLLSEILNISQNVRYLLTVLGIWLFVRNQKSHVRLSHDR